jgi:hypothetical protein
VLPALVATFTDFFETLLRAVPELLFRDPGKDQLR